MSQGTANLTDSVESIRRRKTLPVQVRAVHMILTDPPEIFVHVGRTTRAWQRLPQRITVTVGRSGCRYFNLAVFSLFLPFGLTRTAYL